MMRIDTRGLIALLLFATLLVTAFQGARPLLDPDEGRYTSVALEMLKTGDFIHLEFSPGQPHLTKPPLAYWAIAAGVATFGHNEWGARMPYALAFVLTVWLVVLIAARMGMAQPLWAGLAYTLMFLPYFAANVVTTDAILTLCEALAALGYVGLWRAQSAPQARHWRRIMWLGFALAFLTKGPPGLLPLAAFALHVLVTGGGWRGIRGLFDWAGLLIFAVVGLSWYAVMVWTTDGLLEYYIQDEIVGRVFSGEHHRNPEWYNAFLVYWPALLIGSLPWTGLWLRDAWRWWRRSERHAQDDLRLCLALWIVLPLGVFMLASSRLVLYVLPLLVPLAVWTGLTLQGWKPGKGLVALLLLWVVGLLAVKGGLSYNNVFPQSAGPLQAAVAAQYDHVNVQRYSFVGTQSHYGLRLYTGKRVEFFHFKGQPTPLDEQLCERMNTYAVSRLIFIKPVFVAHFKAVAAGCNVPLEPAGKLRDMAVFYSRVAAADQQQG